jgi:hypothetical protein
MNSFVIGDVAALSAPVVLVTMLCVLLLLGVRAVSGIFGITLSRLASWMLDGSTALLLLMYLVLVVLRFKIIG